MVSPVWYELPCPSHGVGLGRLQLEVVLPQPTLFFRWHWVLLVGLISILALLSLSVFLFHFFECPPPGSILYHVSCIVFLCLVQAVDSRLFLSHIWSWFVVLCWLSLLMPGYSDTNLLFLLYHTGSMDGRMQGGDWLTSIMFCVTVTFRHAFLIEMLALILEGLPEEKGSLVSETFLQWTLLCVDSPVELQKLRKPSLQACCYRALALWCASLNSFLPFVLFHHFVLSFAAYLYMTIRDGKWHKQESEKSFTCWKVASTFWRGEKCRVFARDGFTFVVNWLFWDVRRRSLVGE